jgi:hypothetical protein
MRKGTFSSIRGAVVAAFALTLVHGPVVHAFVCWTADFTGGDTGTAIGRPSLVGSLDPGPLPGASRQPGASVSGDKSVHERIVA